MSRHYISLVSTRERKLPHLWREESLVDSVINDFCRISRLAGEAGMMAVPEDGVAIETRDETDDSERMVIIGTDEIQVHPDLSTTHTSGRKNLHISLS